MICMALSRSAAGVIIFSWTAGIMYSTLFTMPYLLVANYHASQVVQYLQNSRSNILNFSNCRLFSALLYYTFTRFVKHVHKFLSRDYLIQCPTFTMLK